MSKSKSSIASSLANELFLNEEEGILHTPYSQEKAILECVKKGDLYSLKETYSTLPETVYGRMTSSSSELKLMFYASIANTTLVTRYAIEGGLDEELAFSLSDIYIRRMELCTTLEELNEMNEEMAIDFTTRVYKAKTFSIDHYSVPIQRAIEIIHHGSTKNLSLDSLAKSVNLTPKYLSALFHKETGMTLVSFMQKVSIDISKNLLTYSDYSLSEISEYLNFSSQSYFITVFKKYEGMTPKEYRQRYKQINW